MRRAQRIVRVQPRAEKRRDLARQPQHDPAGVARAVRGRRVEDRLEVLVVELRDDRRDHHADRHAGGGERAHRLQPPLRRGRARLERARELVVERGDRDVDARHVLRRHRRDQVEVALDQRRLGHDRERVLVLGQHLDDLPRDLPLALDRLVRVGVGAERDRVAHVAALRELRAQQLRRVGLREELRLEVEARRQVEVRVRRPRVAVDAAVLAALVRIDRLRERDVGRIVARDDRARALDRHGRAELGRRVVVAGSAAGGAQPSSYASRSSRRKRLPGLNVAPRPRSAAAGARRSGSGIGAVSFSPSGGRGFIRAILRAPAVPPATGFPPVRDAAGTSSSSPRRRGTAVRTSERDKQVPLA